jgi:hypothetical protein
MQDIVEYIYVERASCPGNRGIMYYIEGIVEYIDVEEASCPSNGE